MVGDNHCRPMWAEHYWVLSLLTGNADKVVQCRTDQGSMMFIFSSMECMMYSLCSCFASRQTE